MSPASRDTRRRSEDMIIAGCRVQLAYQSVDNGRWRVRGTIQCGQGENSRKQSILTGLCDSPEEAERSAISRITALLGKQVDRSHSRVGNWS